MNFRLAGMLGLVVGMALHLFAQQSAVGNTDFYTDWTITSNTVLQRPLVGQTLRVSGGQTLTLQNPVLTNGALEVVQGRVVLSLTNDLPEPALSSALQSKIAFWVDADTNVVADENGRVSRWHDVREASVDGPYHYMMATNSIVTNQPVVVSDTVLSGKRCLDFGVKKNGNDTDGFADGSAWLWWANTNGVRQDFSTRAVFIVFGAQNSSGGGNCTLIGHHSLAHFAPDSWRLWASTPNTYIDKGLNWFDRVLRDGRNVQLPDKGYHLIEVIGLQTLTANVFARDRNLSCGGSRICEALIFSQEPTDAERLQIEDYLDRKWFGGSKSSVGRVALANDAALELSIGTNRIETTVAGKGTISKTGTGPLVLQNAGSGAFRGTFRLDEGSVYAIGEPFLFDLNEGGQTLNIENVKIVRTNDASTGAIVKTGSGELSVASVSADVTNLTVTAGTLRFAPPRFADAESVTNGTVNEPSLEAFTNDLNASISYTYYTPLGGPWTATVHGWYFDRSSYTSSGNFLVGVASDYNRSGVDVGSVPDGHVVLYLNYGLARTDFTLPDAGFYRLSFWAAARGGSLNRHVDVQVDGKTLRTIVTPSTTYWKHVIRLPFLAAGAHTLGFNAYGADLSRVAFVDDIHIDVIKTGDIEPIMAAVTNASFELPAAMIETGTVMTNQPAGTGWSFEGDAGLGCIQSAGASPRLMPVAVPEGIAAAYVNSNACLRQTITFPTSGVYQLSFEMATRLGYASHAFSVLMNSNLVTSLTSSDIGFHHVDLLLPTVTNGVGMSAELALEGQGGIAGTLFDDVQIKRINSIGQPDAVANGGFEAGDTGWTVTQRSGSVLGGSSEGWQEAAPYGSYLGYMITNNVLKQSVTFTDDEKYAVRFVTKSRSTNIEPLPYYHCFDVYFNGVCVGNVFNANGNTVRTYAFPLPSVAAGEPHELEFRGRYASPATVSFLDAVEIVPQTETSYESLTNRFPEHLVVDVALGADLVLDYEGTVKVETVKYNGQTVCGVISETTHPEFVSGTGSLFSAAKGTLISLQ